MVDAIAHIDVKAPRLTKERFVAGGAAAVAVAGGVVLGIRLRFHNHTPEQAAVCLPFHQPAANQLRGNDLRWTAEEGVGQGWEMLGGEVGGYGSGLGNWQRLLTLALDPVSSICHPHRCCYAPIHTGSLKVTN